MYGQLHSLTDLLRHRQRASKLVRQLQSIAYLQSTDPPPDGVYDYLGCAFDAPELIAMLSEIGRVIQRHYGFLPTPRQVHTALLMSRGNFVELETGSGKSVCLLMAAALIARAGKAATILTSNEYLAHRDYGKSRPLFADLGVVSGTDGIAQKHTVIYTSAKSLASALFSGAKTEFSNAVVLIDEADSLLLDETRIPFVMSEQYQDGPLQQQLQIAYRYVDQMNWLGTRGEALNASEKIKFLQWLERQFADEPLDYLAVSYLVDQVIYVAMNYKRDRHYVVREEKIELLDQFSGRREPDRKLGGVYHSIVELIEAVPLTPFSRNAQKIWFFNLFQRYSWVGGCSGSLNFCDVDLLRLYGAGIYRLKLKNHVFSDAGLRLFSTRDQKFDFLLSQIATAKSQGRPTLVGAESPESARSIERQLQRAGVACGVYDAFVESAEEEALVDEIGRAGQVTVTTNIGGRGTDIKLGAGVEAAGGLQILIYDPIFTVRSDTQLMGRGGRQGEPGSGLRLVSLEDFYARSKLLALFALPLSLGRKFLRRRGVRYRWFYMIQALLDIKLIQQRFSLYRAYSD
ncbi:MAG: hypothetical protein HWE20_00565 [Gammaproteobacteria bacterium]|nr:hypothetical protein [Gammaproteobacteria bacterium]